MSEHIGRPKDLFKRGMRIKTVLITGCGSDIAQNLGRILKKTQWAETLIGCDVKADHLGGLVFDMCDRLPYADDPRYFEALKQCIEKYSIDLIIPASEAELGRLVASGLTEQFANVPLLMANAKAITIGLDKYATAQFLEQHQLNAPWTRRVLEGLPLETPCILKKRFGQGAKHLVLIPDQELAQYYAKHRLNDIWQELLMPDDQEYTCGLYRSRMGEVRSIIIKRVLLGGVTAQGTVTIHREIEAYLHQIASLLDLQGSINVQLRLTARGPVVFEINPRFSSTVYFRHLLGFDDLVWMLMEQQGLPMPDYIPPQPETRFCRLTQEHIL